MRLLRTSLLLILFLFLLTACAGADPVSLILGPQLSVTPATAPITIPGTTPPAPTVSDALVVAQVGSPTPPQQILQPTVTVKPVRTPIRLKVPATPPEYPTETPTISPTPTPDFPATAAAQATATANSPSPTPNFITATPTATLYIITATPTPLPPATPSPTASPYPENGQDAILTDVSVADELLPTPVSRPLGLENTLNILVIGSDERASGRPYRTDVIMIAAVDFANKEVGIISFPRDMWVRIPHPKVGQNRINTATFFGELYKYPNGGGIGLLKDTIGKNFGVRIDHYVKFSFNSFQDVIDALGGINVEVDCPITGNFPREPGSKLKVWKTLQPGEYHMDGFFALQFVRQRKTTSDIDRARRQQRVIIAIRNRAREVNIIPRLPALYDALSDSIETDLGLTDIIALARLGIQIDPSKAHGLVIGYKDLTSWRTPSGAAVLLPDIPSITRRIEGLFTQPSILKNPQKPRNCR